MLGIAFVLPIGGADVPVLISLLNSFTGLAVAASGFTLGSNLLIVAGTLVGASGILLTRLMSKAMGRSLSNVLFSAFGSVVTASGATTRDDGRSVRSGTPEDVGVLLSFASRVVIIPGYGLAVAQAQHVLRELAEELETKGIEVFYAIHPVAGRMPGHMNVLLAEANVPYEQLLEMDEANSELPDGRRRAGGGRERHRQPGRDGRQEFADLRHADHQRGPGGERGLPEALDATRLRRHRERAALQPQDDAGLRRREGHAHQDGGGRQGQLARQLVAGRAIDVARCSARTARRVGANLIGVGRTGDDARDRGRG